MSGEQGKPVESQSKQRYTVSCSWIKRHAGVDENDSRTLTLFDGEKGSIDDTYQSPFVIGVRLPNPKEQVPQPYIVVLHEGLKIDLLITGFQPNGVTMDVTVEQSQITKVDTKQINADKKTTVQIPSVDIQKKRIFDFVKFGEALVVPTGEKLADDKISRIEIVVGLGENIQPSRKVTGNEQHPRQDVTAASSAIGGGIKAVEAR